MVRCLKGLYHLLIALIANIRFGFPGKSLTVIGVTGTDGKTTTTTLIFEILNAAGKNVSMITSVQAVIAGKIYDTGFHVTTPDAWMIQKLLRKAVDHGDTHVVLETTSHGLAQHRVYGIPYHIGVITNVTHEHLDWHTSFNEYMQTKISLLQRADIAVINKDEKELYGIAIPLIRQKQVITYGMHRDAQINPRTLPFTTKLPGIFNTYNCLAAAAAATALNIQENIIRRSLSAFKGIAGRMEILQSKPFTVIVDFAHTPNALENALRCAKEMTKNRLIHVFGSAGLRDSSKRPLMGESSSRYADVIILTEEDYRTENVESIMDSIARGITAGPAVYRIPDRAKAIEFALKTAKSGDLVMITGKGHEKSLCRGTKEYPWSDQKAVCGALKRKQ